MLIETTNPVASNLYMGASAAWIAGALLTFISDITGIKLSDRFLATLSVAGSLLAIAAVVLCFNTESYFSITKYITFGLAPFSCHSDALSSVMVSLFGMVSIAAAFASPSFASTLKNQAAKNHYWKLFFIFLFGLLQVILSDNAIAFLVFWEVMSIAASTLIASDHIRHRAQRASIAYITASRTSTAFLTAAFLWMHSLSSSWQFSQWHFNTPEALVASALILLGTCTKAGIWPMHVYLPQSYSEPPGPVAALICGLMGKMGIYVMLRLLIEGDCNSLIIAYVALALGTISCVWGIIFALVERDLKRLLAYSSVENMGLIMVGMAAAMLAKINGFTAVGALAITGVLFHVVNHGLFKALLMLGASHIERAAHTRDLSLLGGLAKRMPWTMLCFFIGSMAICAMPPLNGFASKWLIYQSFFKLSFAQAPLLDRAIALGMVGILAFVGALSLACYAKAVGIAFLGRARSQNAAQAKESADGQPDGPIYAQLLLAIACILLGTSAPIFLNALSPALAFLTHDNTVNAANLFPIPQGQICLVGALLASTIYVFILGQKTQEVSTYITWDCGFGPLSARTEETGSSFSHPIGRIFSQILQLSVKTEIKGKDRRHFPESIRVETNMSPFLETRVYRDFLNILNWLSLTMTRLQTGSIHVHLLYVFLTMILLVLLGTNI